jgi:hypothetical protein
MATTIRLLSTYNGYKPQSIITVDDAIATQLIAGLNATTDLTGGAPAFQPGTGSGLSSGTNLPANRTLLAGQTDTLTVPSGVSLGVNASSDIAGTREVLNPDGTVASSTPLLAGLSTVGVFVVDTKVRFNVTFGTLTVKAGVVAGSVDAAPVFTSSATLAAGENQDRDWQAVANGADQVLAVQSGMLDTLLGVTGAAGDFLHHLDVYITDSTKSQVVIRDGVTAPSLSLITHASTASTTTVINTATNPAAVTADQYKGSLLKVGGEYRRILTHTAFAANAVNTYTLDRALSAAPGTGVAFVIEDRRYVWELIPNGMTAAAMQWDCQFRSYQAGWRLTTEAGVRLRAVGDFT